VISGAAAVRDFLERIGFRESFKMASAEKALAALPAKSFVKRGVIPAGRLFTEIRGELSVASKEFRDSIGIAVDNYEYGVYNPSREMLGRISDGIEAYGCAEKPACAQLRRLAECDLDFIRVREKREIAPSEDFVYDITTRKNHNFIANRLFSSNCVLDEAWKVAKDDNSDAVMIVREGRKYQFMLIVASQNPTDISEAIFSNVGTTFILRVKFERFLDYLQNTLNFSEFMRHEISRFGVGQAAVNMAFQTTAAFSETFLLEKIEGEEPLVEYRVDIESVLTPEQMKGELMAKTYSFERNDFKRKLRAFGLDDVRVEEVSTLFEKRNKHLDVVYFVILLERFGIARSNITAFLKDIGIDDSTIINIFSKADFKKLGMEDKDITQVILTEG